MIYLTLFSISFLSATLLPLGSEALLVYDSSLNANIFLLWFVATLGNSLGSMVNYILGYRGEVYLLEKQYIKKSFFDRYGAWSLWLSWLPIIGDPLTFVAGLLRYDFKRFALIVSFAKGLRYAVVIFLASSLSV